MKKELEDLINETTIGNKLSEHELKRLLNDLDIKLPNDYIEFLSMFNVRRFSGG